MYASNDGRRLGIGLAAAVLCAVLNGCGTSGAGTGQALESTAPTTSSTASSAKKAATPRPTSPRGPSRAALLRRMKEDPEVQGVSQSYITCMADLAMKYGEPKDLQRYIDGSIKSDDIKGLTPSNKRFWNEADKCLT
jgi:hypothetical protein